MSKQKNTRQAEFIQWMGPLLEALRELGNSGNPREVSNLIAKTERLPVIKLNEVMKSGSPKFPNQVAWARQYLVWEGLLDSSQKGIWKLTDRGSSTKLTYEESRKIFLKWVEIFAKARKDKTQQEIFDESSSEDIREPESIETSLVPTLLQVLQSITSEGFERICRELLRKSGFEEVRVTGRSRDGGIDGIGMLQVNPFVSFKVLFQCKRYKDGNSVTAPQIRDFQAAMMGRADKGIFMTTSIFTQDAEKEANRDGAIPIELIDGKKLVSLFEKVELGVKPQIVYEVDINFFESYGFNA